MPAQQRRVGLQELGLPYAADAAITRHLARFLRQQAATPSTARCGAAPSGLACPTHVLFNGGVLNAALVRERILACSNAWLAEEGAAGPAAQRRRPDARRRARRGILWPGAPRPRRAHPRRRAAHLLRRHRKRHARRARIPAPLKALTVAPFGMEEGTDVRIPGREFGLVVGEPAEFRFFTSAVRKNDQAGDLIEDFGDELEELSPMEVTSLPGRSAEVVPVSFETVVTETGMLQFWWVARDGRRWKLEFNVRERVQA